MKKRILVLYYSQSGQLRDILDNILYDIQHKVEIDVVQVEMENPFPFPWTSATFFDAMPECVELIPSAIKPLPHEVMNNHHDLVLFGWQPWFLSPSQPTTSFLKSQYAAILKDKPVITVIGSRNMWLNGQEQVKVMLKEVGAKLVGNIVLTDTNSNLISVLTIARWAFTGQKAASSILPEAGVQTPDIKNAQRFGMQIYKHLENNRLEVLQKELLMQGAIHLDPGLVILEKRGIKNFRKFAKYIREKGGPLDPNRKSRVKIFQYLLTVIIFILSPISSFTAMIQMHLQKKSLLRDVEYFKNLAYQEDML
ncbi:MAG: hypothetical protein KDC07_05690 [Chitinophagaceae bacterium]|nr:hypothetical protein [Chitinophagaceae bacterium]MCB9046898.1 dialkylresorcinol condensing enzyme DarA [Chitinophagales bacterium]